LEAKTPVSLIFCADYEPLRVQQCVENAIACLGGLETAIKPGENILIKPNLLSARAPERAVTTHPEVVRAVVRLVKAIGATPLIGDSPGGAVKGVMRVWQETGMYAVAKEEHVELINFETAGANERGVNNPLVPVVHISKVLDNVDGIINIPKLKTHGLTIYTGCVKNFYGTIPGLRKAEYHKAIPPSAADFGPFVGEIYLLNKHKVRLNLMDGVWAMEGNGPSSGDVRKLGIIAASRDANALDMAIVKMLGINPQRIGTIKYISNLKGEVHSNERIELRGEPLSSFNFDKFKLPPTWFYSLIPRRLVRFLGRFVWMKPVIIPELCTNCMMCVNSCPVKAVSAASQSVKPVVIAKNCISCLCCHELCQYNAIELRKSSLAKILIRG